MPIRRRRAPKRKLAKRKGNRRGRAPKSSTQMARITETIEFNNISPNVVQSLTFNIGLFERARVLATNFRWVKPTRVTWELKPQFNVYQSGVGANTVPYVYTIMNRTQDSSFMTLNDLLTQGARPVKLTSLKKLSYKPNWCSPGLLVQNVVALPGGFGGALNNIVVQGLKPEYGWCQCPNLTTQPNTVTPLASFIAPPSSQAVNTSVANLTSGVRYNGHQIYIDQLSATSTTGFRLVCKVDWAFKDPKNTLATINDNIFEDVSGSIPQMAPEDV